MLCAAAPAVMPATATTSVVIRVLTLHHTRAARSQLGLLNRCPKHHYSLAQLRREALPIVRPEGDFGAVMRKSHSPAGALYGPGPAVRPARSASPCRRHWSPGSVRGCGA